MKLISVRPPPFPTKHYIDRLKNVEMVSYVRRRFRSQTSDYGQMESRAGKSQREEKSRREKIREEKESEEVREKVGKSRNIVSFQ